MVVGWICFIIYLSYDLYFQLPNYTQHFKNPLYFGKILGFHSIFHCFVIWHVFNLQYIILPFPQTEIDLLPLYRVDQ